MLTKSQSCGTNVISIKRNKRIANERSVTQYKRDKGKASQIDGILNICDHIQTILGKKYEVDRNGQPKAKVTNIKGG